MKAFAKHRTVYSGMGDEASGTGPGWDITTLDTGNWTWPSFDSGGTTGTITNTTNTGNTSGSGIADFTKILGSVTSSFTNIFKAIQPVPEGCQTVAGPYGTSVQCASTGQTLTSNLTSSSSSIGGISLTTLLVIGGGLLLLMKAGK